MEKKLFVVIIIILVLSLFVILPAQQRSDEAYISQWAGDNSHNVSSIERCYWTMGPYWYSKNTRIYKVKTDDGTFWFRFRFLGTDIEEYE